jgi:hypothetical protein
MSITEQTLVSLDQGLKNVWRMSYEGKIVRLSIDDEHVGLTPNQPVLTPDGWVPAKDLRGGDTVVCCPATTGWQFVGLGAGQVVASMKRIHNMLTHHAFTIVHLQNMDFHGESFGFGTDKFPIDESLLNCLHSAFFQPTSSAVDGPLTYRLSGVGAWHASAYVYTMETGVGYFGVGPRRIKVRDCTTLPPVLMLEGVQAGAPLSCSSQASENTVA